MAAPDTSVVSANSNADLHGASDVDLPGQGTGLTPLCWATGASYRVRNQSWMGLSRPPGWQRIAVSYQACPSKPPAPGRLGLRRCRLTRKPDHSVGTTGG